MSQEPCWECEESYARNEVFDIPVFHKGYTIKWCFNCAMKQLEWSDYRLVTQPKLYKKFKIQSIEDGELGWRKIMDELVLCFENQFRKLKDIDYSWGEIQQLANEIQYPSEELTSLNDSKSEVNK